MADRTWVERAESLWKWMPTHLVQLMLRAQGASEEQAVHAVASALRARVELEVLRGRQAHRGKDAGLD